MRLPSKAELAEDEPFTAARAGDAARVSSLLQQAGAAASARANARNFVRDTPLAVASQCGHLAVVEALLRAGADPNAAFEYGASPLAAACERGDAPVVRALLRAGARVDHANSWGAAVLHMAATRGALEVVELLLAAGADPNVRDKTGATPLTEADTRGHADVARALRHHRDHHKAALSASAFLSAVDGGVLDAVRRGVERLGVSASARVKDPQDRSAMDLALSHRRVEIVRALVESGVAAATNAASSDRRTLLHRAVITKDNAIVSALLEDKHSGHVAIDAADAAGWTALHFAVRARSVEIVKTLLRHGASVNLQTTGRRGEPTTRYEASALHLAIRSDDTAILKLLLACEGVQLNLRNDAGRTPLLYAVSLERVEAAALLLEAGADVNVLADAGESALLVAVYRACDETAHALLRHGARTDVVARSGRSPLSVAKTPEMREVLELYGKSQQYHDKCFAYLSPQGETPTIAKLTDLVPLITSVYDLRHMLTLIVMCDPKTSSPAERRVLLNAAFLHVVDHKLTFDDEACVFFKLSLERCERDKLVPREDFLLLDRKAEKANTESAAWVLEMKKQVYTNSWRLDGHDQHLHAVTNGLREVHAMVMENRKVLVKVSRRVGSIQKQVQDGKRLVVKLSRQVHHTSGEVHRFESRLAKSEANIQRVASSLQNFKEAYVDQIQLEERRQKIKRVCGIVAAVAGFVFAPVLKEVADAVVDFVNPIDIVTKVFVEHDIASFLSEKSESSLPEAIQDQLIKLAIPQDEFEVLLREEIVLQHPEYLDECTERGLTVSVDGGRADIARALEPSLHAEEEVVLNIIGELQALSSVSTPRDSIAGTLGVSTFHVSAPLRSTPTAQARASKAPLLPPPVIDVHRRSIDQSSQFRLPDRVSLGNAQIRSPPRSPPRSPTSSLHLNGKVVFVDDLAKFQNHEAVLKSRGNLREFTALLKALDTRSCDPNVKMKMQLRTATKSRETLSAAEYAYRRGYREVGDWLAVLRPATSAMHAEPAISVEPLRDLDDFPLILAVKESEGDLESCKHLVDALMDLTDEQDESLDATIEAEVERVTSSQAVEWSAVEYASHLGYEDIVRFMLMEICKTTTSTRTKLQLLKTARERASQTDNVRASPSA